MPGIAPKNTPNSDWRTVIFHRLSPSLAQRSTSAVEISEVGGATGRRVMVKSSISGNSNSPNVDAMRGSPAQRTGWPKTKRTSSVVLFSPMVPNSTPSRPVAIPLTMAPALRAETMAMPNNASAAISGKPNLRMTGLMKGTTAARVRAPMMPPNAETA